MIARMHRNALRFYIEDGWQIDNLRIGLDEGELIETTEYYQLSPTKRGYFNLKFLTALVDIVYLQSGAIASTRERDVCLKYFSQVGLFDHGDLAGVKRCGDR